MSYDSLADFLEELADAGELLRVAAEVDAELELAEITRRVAAEGGPALLFENVRGSSRAVVANLLGTPGRVCRALAIERLDDISARAEALIEKHTPHNWFDRLKISADEAGVNKFRPRIVKSGPCQQVVRLGRDVDLAALPAARQWPGESHPAITAAQLITVDPGNDVRAVTICPLQVLDANRLAIVDDGRSGLARHWSRYREAKQKMPVAAVLGGDPAGAIAASLELGESVDFLHVEGLLRGKSLEVVKCRTHALEVPARADLVLEGYVDPEAVAETVESFVPGGSYYRPPAAALVLHVTAITERSHPIVPVAIDCGSRGETAALALARERMLLPAVQRIAPDVVDMHLPAFGGLERWGLVAFDKRYPFHARQVASALWGSTALSRVTFLVLVDRQVDVHDVAGVLGEVGANVAPGRDTIAYEGPAAAIDPASGLALGRHLALDATAKIAGEQVASGPAALAAGEEIRQLVDRRWSEYRLELAAEAARSG